MVNCSIITPSYFCSKKEIEVSKNNLRKIGFQDIYDFSSKNQIYDMWAGSVGERLVNLYKSWSSDSDVIWCCKGGSGTSHLFTLINFKKFRKKKLLVGFSDMTILLNIFHEKLGLITLHGPNSVKKLDQKSISALKDSLQMKNYGIKYGSNNLLVKSSKNLLKGKIIGGNLSRFFEMFFDYDLDLRNKIVFFEETDSTEHKIFNRLFYFKNNRKFKPKAILFGDLGIKKGRLMKDMIRYLFPDTPILTDLSFGHCSPNITIPIGADCEIDFKNKKIKFLFPRKHKKYAVKLD